MKIITIEKSHRHVLFFSFVMLMLVSMTVYGIYQVFYKPIVLEIGIFAGSMYDVPNWQSYKAFDDEIKKFENIHPGVKITYRSGTLKEDYSEWLAQKIIKGKEPDVFCVLPGDFNTFAYIGIMNELDEFIQNDRGFDIDNMYINAIKSGQFNHHQYALPREVDPQLMFVNKTILKKEGIQIPKGNWTWDDFYHVCEQVTKDLDGDGKLDQFGSTGFSWQHAVYTNGRQLFDANGEQAKFNQPEVLEAVDFVRRLNRLNQNFIVTQEDFDNGKVAFSPFPFSAYRAYKSYPYRIIRYARFDWECVKLPKGPHGKNASALNSMLFAMSSRSKHKKEAWAFIQYLTNNYDSQVNVFRYSHGVPVLRNVTESKEADKELSKYNPEEEISVDKRILSEVIEQSTVTPKFHKYEEAMNMSDKEIYQMINGDRNIEDTLRQLDQKLNKFLQE
ncbi:MAG: ABC transporter substrate-binding protein [Bacillota bacterium]